MGLSLKEHAAAVGLADMLYDFLPGSGTKCGAAMSPSQAWPLSLELAITAERKMRPVIATAGGMTALLKGSNVRAWSWISSTSTTLASSFEAHGPALSLTPGGEAPGQRMIDGLVAPSESFFEINFSQV